MPFLVKQNKDLHKKRALSKCLENTVATKRGCSENSSPVNLEKKYRKFWKMLTKSLISTCKGTHF